MPETIRPLPISQLRAPERSLVGWLTGEPAEDVRQIFRQRGFEIVQYPPSAEFASQNVFDGVRAFVLDQDDSAPNASFADQIALGAKTFLNAGCAFVVRPLSKGRRTALQTLASLRLPTAGFDASEATWFRQRDGEDCPAPHARLFSPNVPWYDVANFVTSYEPGRRVNRQLDVTGIAFSDEQLVLIQRAFSDCSRVHFSQMSEKGRSGVDVFHVHADLIGGHLGPWPQPYFVKLGEREKIYREYHNYQTSVHPYLPYYLAPRLVNERCCLGADTGIIVGDFVEESEGLLDCAQQARGAAPLSYLFDHTLRGWYRNAQVEQEPFGLLLRRMAWGTISQKRMDRASEFGDPVPVPDILDAIGNIASSDVLMGPAHGDLHAGNIRVRKSDAILIDFFAQQKRAPLLIDLASLEASFIVDGFQDDPRLSSDPAQSQAWFDSIRPLYAGDPLKADTNVCHPKDPSHWFYTSIRIVRRHAREMEQRPMQYAAALVVALLRKATKDDGAAEPEATRRAAAYLLASALSSVITAATEATK